MPDPADSHSRRRLAQKISGTVDSRDSAKWADWHLDHQDNKRDSRFPEAKVLLFVGLVLPPLVFFLAGWEFDGYTYFGGIGCWVILFLVWRLIIQYKAIRKAKRGGETYPFEIERKDQTIRLSVRDSSFEYPSNMVSAIRLMENVILTVEEKPICISPRNENFDGGHSIDDLFRMIKDTP